MYEPMIQSGSTKRYRIVKFGGLNQTESVGEHEFSDMKNMCCMYPYIRTRPKRTVIDVIAGDIKKIIRLEQQDGQYVFTGIAQELGNTKFYYENQEIETEKGSLTADSVAVMGQKVIIFPDQLYFDLSEPSKGLVDMASTVSISSAVFYSKKDQTSEVITNYIQGSSFDGFEKGDSIIVSGCSNSKNNTVKVSEITNAVESDDIVSMIVEKTEGNKLYLLCYNAQGVQVELKKVTSSCTVKKEVPDMNYICVHNNRLWGTGADGRFVYASKLGAPENFNSFAGLSTDSWWSEVATDGLFVGIISYQNHVYAFKKTCIHEIYGDKPSNFKIPYAVNNGCIDGRSIVELNSYLYYAGADGVYVYNGGIPKCISRSLEYRAGTAVSAVDGKNLYLSLDGVMYVYDTEYDTWYKHDDEIIHQIYHKDTEKYFVSENGIYLEGGESEYISWSITSGEFRRASYKTGIISMWLSMNIAQNTIVSVYTSEDGGDYRLCDSVYGDNGMFCIRVRFNDCNTFRIMVKGCGDAKIYGIEFENYIGGRQFRNTVQSETERI